MMQGDQYLLPIQIETETGFLSPDLLDDLEILIGSIRKTMKGGEISFDENEQTFLAHLTQKETFRLKGESKAQARCKFSDGSVIGVSLGVVTVEVSASKVVL